MDTSNKKCEECGEELKPSQYARKIGTDGQVMDTKDNLACRNYPKCSKAEKEIPKEN